MRDQGPHYRDWKVEATHSVFWELFPTVDHVHSVAGGGSDDTGNWVTTSMFRNLAKAHWTLEELG